MKKIMVSVVVLMCMVSFVAVGCGPKKANSSGEAIDTAKAMDSVEKQVKYLEGQADAFLKSKEYKEALDVANYIQKDLNTQSGKVEQIVKEAESQLGGFLKDTMKKISG